MYIQVIRFVQRFSENVVTMAETFFHNLNFPLSKFVASSAVGKNQFIQVIIKRISTVVPDITLLEFITLNVSSIVAIIVLKWFKEIFL